MKKATETTPEVIPGFKGFDKDLKCRDKKYEVGKEYSEDKAIPCEIGMHFCEYPMDIFSYYPPANSRFTEVEGSGTTARHDGDSKVACTHLKIGAELSLKKIIESSIKFTFDRVKWTKENTSNGDRSGATSNGDNSGATSNGDSSGATSNGYSSGATSNGDRSGATSNGYSSGATSNGDRSGATSNGNRSGATSNGDNSTASAIKGGVATVIGKNCRAKGALGAWLSITEGDYDNNNDFYIKDLKAVLVDGKTIKVDTYYQLINSKIVVAENQK